MNLLTSFQKTIKENNLFSEKDRLLLAVSGGVDSVVLCELCKQAGYDFSIAHCNFQLRGEESERDERFVRQLGEKYKVEIEVKRFDTEKYAKEKKMSTQEAARELRYTWFFELVNSRESGVGSSESGVRSPESLLPSPGYLLTAHHGDDNAETVLMNFCRGTGLHGLTGMPASGNTGSGFSLQTFFIRRPLLDFSKEELIQFAKENKLDYVEDSSNLSSKYTRNLFRNEIIPAMGKVYPQVKKNLQDNIRRFKEIERLYQLSVNEIKKKLCKQKENEVHIPIKQLMGYKNRALIYEIIAGYSFSEKQVEEVVKLSESGSGKYIQSPDNRYRIIRHRHWFIITPVISVESENIVIDEKDKTIQFLEGTLRIETAGNGHPATGNQIACLDAKEIQFPLLLRKWKTGDYFYPLGMRKKKKLARFFIDQKLSKAAKEKVWVLEMNKKIIWVVGHRIDDRFKIAATTKSELRISFTSGETE
ncbi:MAG TPA: tRNA lysidine(34) synthetase TilS [Chitinophagaceae bacterium]|nr:tRNA lysidine(34) synthetase TilS [Chitinophagaceae bacterium]